MTVSTDVLIAFTVRLTEQHPVNESFLKKIVQRIIEAQSGFLESK